MKLCLCLLCVVLGTVAKFEPLRRDTPLPGHGVAQSLIEELGAEDYEARERASEKLRQMGREALLALAEAAASDDPEVRMRARRILGDLRMGIEPGWPAQAVLLVRHYKDLNREGKRDAMRQLARTLGEKAVPFLVLQMGAGDASEARDAFNTLQSLLDNAKAWNEVVGLIIEPKNDWQTKALAWARTRLGFPQKGLEALAGVKEKEGLRKAAIEAGVKKLLAQLKAERYGAVAADAEKFIASAPGEPRFLYLQGEVLAALGRKGDAVTCREKALALNPRDEAPHFVAGELLTALGRRRLAAREWQAILEMPPADGVYDINALLRLGASHGESGLFGKAVGFLTRAQRLYTRARENDKGFGMIGGTEKELQRRIETLRGKAAKYPARPGLGLVDRPSEKQLRINVVVRVKDGKQQALEKALASAHGTASLTVKPYGLRLFDKAPATVCYDRKTREMQILLNGRPAWKVGPLNMRGEKARLAVLTLDSVYIFEIDRATGKGEKRARFEKDYAVTIAASGEIADLRDVLVTVNKKRYTWPQLLKGLPFDYLPQRLEVVIEGTTPDGRRVTSEFAIDPKEPPLTPRKEKAPSPSPLPPARL